MYRHSAVHVITQRRRGAKDAEEGEGERGDKKKAPGVSGRFLERAGEG
uniref:Uncharacterized protein n=1 Tax=uncultured bacterium contig00007 TaxID=1181499 RepID=A0A806K270_9BACT|nr:hypothetical protein [uncultured bacterium contig00007]